MLGHRGCACDAAEVPDDDHPASAAHEGQPGFPTFEHNQWTFEGEIERFGAVGRAGASARGWKRYVAVLVAMALVLPLVLGMVVSIWQAVR